MEKLHIDLKSEFNSYPINIQDICIDILNGLSDKNISEENLRNRINRKIDQIISRGE